MEKYTDKEKKRKSKGERDREIERYKYLIKGPHAHRNSKRLSSKHASSKQKHGMRF